jgi:hypothetical protein
MGGGVRTHKGILREIAEGRRNLLELAYKRFSDKGIQSGINNLELR